MGHPSPEIVVGSVLFVRDNLGPESVERLERNMAEQEARVTSSPVKERKCRACAKVLTESDGGGFPLCQV